MPPSERDRYDSWFSETFKSDVKAPGSIIATSWAPETRWGHAAHCALLDIEVSYVKELIAEISERNIPGDFAEFGVFEGWWISTFWQLTEEARLNRKVFGFDSFKGLSNPHPTFDGPEWEEGQFACDLETVRTNVKAPTRSRIKLIEGFFSESLRTGEASSVGQLAFVRIDCDLYEPALQCLTFIGPRLVDGAILVFDDWPFEIGIGEQRAFAEWLSQVPHLRFEFLFYNTWKHLYLRVHRSQVQIDTA